jgi:hypothetical protein
MEAAKMAAMIRPEIPDGNRVTAIVRMSSGLFNPDWRDDRNRTRIRRHPSHSEEV